jgi:hypothetical protein
MDAKLIEKIRQLPRWALESFTIAATDLLHCRAGKLLITKKPFIVVANDEPYFGVVYEMIRETEREKGTWTPECEDAFLAAMKEIGE